MRQRLIDEHYMQYWCAFFLSFLSLFSFAASKYPLIVGESFECRALSSRPWRITLTVRPKWHSYFLFSALGLIGFWSKVVHYIRNRVLFLTQTSLWLVQLMFSSRLQKTETLKGMFSKKRLTLHLASWLKSSHIPKVVFSLNFGLSSLEGAHI